ncbi:hypothetical protein K488DRAFT_91307 [Vararia minispora EC-137]|uniref:Uncharacterized protein n=1 Tax=Vararia minispora EC-137 TaxID=1314806 RepID=A0ACB8Q655_9AGAM|nr:hypothetical protein K488DRAFT_91307 [Vararia minispora EC-137]
MRRISGPCKAPRVNVLADETHLAYKLETHKEEQFNYHHSQVNPVHVGILKAHTNAVRSTLTLCRLSSSPPPPPFRLQHAASYVPVLSILTLIAVFHGVLELDYFNVRMVTSEGKVLRDETG